MTQDEAQRQIAAIEAEANARCARLRYVRDSDPKPGSGEPGHLYGVVAAMAYEAKNAQAIAEIEAEMHRRIEDVEAAYYAHPEE